MNTGLHKHKIISIFLFLIAFLLSGCAARPYLIVDYQIPAASTQLQGQELRIEVKDMRTDSDIFTTAAAQQFEGFEGRYSLAWVSGDRNRVLAGEHDLSSLFLETFKKRLQQMGVAVVSNDRSSAPLFIVSLKTFKIDLRDHKWTAHMNYEAGLSVGSQVLAKESVNGESERVRIIGRKGADDNLSSLFTEMINRLDIYKLYQQAKLI